MTNPLSSFAHRTARWCALHPWRAILGWVAFVAFAVGLATMIPTQETTDADYRLGESGRADAMVSSAGFDEPDTEQVLITGPGPASTLDQALGPAGRRRRRRRHDRRCPRSTRSPSPRPARTGRRTSSRSSWPATKTDVVGPAGRHRGRAGRLPAARGPRVRRREPRRRHRRPGRRRPVLGRDAQPADHADPDAAGLRRAHRRRASRCCSPAPASPPPSASWRRSRT